MSGKKRSKICVDFRGAKHKFGWHAGSGQYRKKHQGKDFYLGNDPEQVLERWFAKLEAFEADQANRPREVEPDEVTVEILLNNFLATQEHRRNNGELAHATYLGYLKHAKIVTKFFGPKKLISDLGPDDFARLKAWFYEVKPVKAGGKLVPPIKDKLSLETVRTYIRVTRIFFRYAVDEGYLDRVPYTRSSFGMPTKKNVKAQQREKLPKQASREEIKAIYGVADDTAQALILLALNSGSGNSDAALLKWADIVDGWVETPRSKTSEIRRFKLWPETLEALEKIPRHSDGLIFHGSRGGSYITKGLTSQLSRIFQSLSIKAGVRRENLTFYSLRHTFQSIADEHLDFPATSRVMGHSSNSMSDIYRGTISDERLEGVTEHVRKWYFQEELEVAQ